jgi:hypothetical protein
MIRKQFTLSKNKLMFYINLTIIILISEYIILFLTNTPLSENFDFQRSLISFGNIFLLIFLMISGNLFYALATTKDRLHNCFEFGTLPMILLFADILCILYSIYLVEIHHEFMYFFFAIFSIILSVFVYMLISAVIVVFQMFYKE